jgi:arylsulfatase A-like enzyme
MQHSLTLFTALLLAPLAALHAASDKPNIVLIVADDLGYGDVACYGSSIPTPNIDRLAREGTRFTDFHSNGSVCSPTRCALMTGRYQQRAGIAGLVRGDNGMSPDEFTIAEAMKSSGYVTAMFGKWHLGELPNFNPVKQGFDEYKGSLGGRIDYFTHQAAGKPHHLDWWNGVDSLEEKGYSTTLIADHSVAFIQRSKSKPFFLYVAFNAPHTPLESPGVPDGKGPDAYRKVVEWMDKETGRIVAAIQEEGLADNTFVFFFSDNGGHEGIPGCSNKPLRGFKGSFWEGGHREPAIARWPGRIPVGKVTDQTAMGMDLMPTVMELAGATLPANRKLDGISLASLLSRGQPLPQRKLFWAQGKNWAMRDGPWKLLHDQDTVYLFDLSQDLGEQNDLSARFPERVKKMSDEVQAWAADVDARRIGVSTSKQRKGNPANVKLTPADDE